MAKVKFPGVDEDITAPNTPWIYYGVCANHMPLASFADRTSGVVRWCSRGSHEGSLSSTGLRSCCVQRYVLSYIYKGRVPTMHVTAVTHASIENWEYMEIIRQAADPKCSAHLENSIQTIDATLARGDDPIGRTLKRRLKGLFGLAGLEHDEDFVSLIEVR